MLFKELPEFKKESLFIFWTNKNVKWNAYQIIYKQLPLILRVSGCIFHLKSAPWKHQNIVMIGSENKPDLCFRVRHGDTELSVALDLFEALKNRFGQFKANIMR